MGCQLVSLTKAKVFTLLSVWGIIMLSLLGVAFKQRSPALYEDINLDKENPAVYSNQAEVYDAYDGSASNCFIAAGCYLALFVFSLWQWKVGNTAASHTTIR